MKKIIKIALVAVLLANIAPISAMGRFTGQLGKVVQQKAAKAFKVAQQKVTKIFAKPAQKIVPKEEIKALNEKTFEAASTYSSYNKKYAESVLLDRLHKWVEEGIVPNFKHLRELDQLSWKAKHGVLNLSDKDGHTFLYKAFHLPESSKRSNFLRALDKRGAMLNAKDKEEMGPEKRLKVYLNLPMEASAWRTIKAYRTFLTKNTEEKLGRFNDLYKQKRLNKVKDVQDDYAQVQNKLLKERHFKFEELV